MSRRILILGAGVCGLAAAYRLLENDPTLHVTLLEQEERPGGLARSLTLNGQVADLGPHRLFTELPDVQDFLEDLAGKELEEVTRSSRMWLRGGWIEYPPKPLEIMQHLGIGKLAGAGASYALHKAGALLGGGGNERESFESLMTDAFGPELYNMLVAPYARKVWKVEPSQIHADIARVRVSAGGGVTTGSAIGSDTTAVSPALTRTCSVASRPSARTLTSCSPASTRSGAASGSVPDARPST